MFKRCEDVQVGKRCNVKHLRDEMLFSALVQEDLL